MTIKNNTKSNKENKKSIDLRNKKTTISNEIQFESVKKADELIKQLKGRYNL